MNAPLAQEKSGIEVRHLAATMAPKVHKELVPKSLLHLQELLAKEKGKSVFEATLAKEDADIYVNFTEMRQIVDTEKDPDPNKPESAQPERWKRLNTQLGIYDKMLNGNIDKLGEKDGVEDPAEKHMVLKVLGEIPGFAEAIAVATDGQMSIEQVQKYLAGKREIPGPLRKTVAEMINGFIGDEELRRRMEKSLSTLEIPSTDVETQQQLEAAKNEMRGKDVLTQKRDDLEVVINKYKGLTADERGIAESTKTTLDSLLDRLPAKYKMVAPDKDMVSSYLSSVDALMQSKNTDIAGLTAEIKATKKGSGSAKIDLVSLSETQRQTLRNELAELADVHFNLTKIKETMSNEQQMKLYKMRKDFVGADESIKGVNDELSKKEMAERKVKDLEAKRNKVTDKYKRKLERTLSEEMKRYWNQVKVEDAILLAAAEANEKSTLETKTKDEAEKRAAMAEDILDKYLRLSFMKYNRGKEVGYDDDAIKKFMHNDMLSQSPAQLARTLLERVDTKSGSMPPKYRDEIDKLFMDMRKLGIEEGKPPLSMDALLDGIDQEKYFAIAAKKVPDTLGYAWARGFYFDRMKLKKHEAMFLTEAYRNPKFFELAAKGRSEQIQLAEKLLADNVLSGGLTEEKMKELLGQDWTEGLGRLVRVLAVGAGVGATAYTLGGGLAYGLHGAGLAEGLRAVKDNVMALGTVAGSAAVATSRASNMALHGLVGNYAVANIPANGGSNNAGGLIEGLDKLNSGPLKLKNVGPVSP